MRYLLFSLLLALAACAGPPTERADAIVLDSFAPPRLALYPKSDGKPFSRSYPGKTYLADLSIGRIEHVGGSLGHFELGQGITLRVFRDGVLYLQVKADHASCFKPFDEVIFSGMTGFSRDSVQAEVENMRWKAGEPLVRTEDFVELVLPDRIIEGRGLEASLDFEYYAIDKVTRIIGLEIQP